MVHRFRATIAHPSLAALRRLNPDTTLVREKTGGIRMELNVMEPFLKSVQT